MAASIDPTELPNGCTEHGAVGRDVCMRDELLPSYLYLFCTLDAIDAATCE